MANLLPREGRPEPFAPLDAQQRRRLRARARSLRAVRALRERSGAPFENWLEGALDSGAELLEEVECGAASPAMLEGLLETVEAARRDALARAASRAASGATHAGLDAGVLLGWWPGRSLETGEAEAASRGLFDARDRPPAVGWLLGLARRDPARREGFELLVVAWAPAAEAERAVAGCEACRSGAVDRLEGCAPELVRPLCEALRAVDAEPHGATGGAPDRDPHGR